MKFLAIAASNLDEFYTKRVGWLKRVLNTDPRTRTVDGRTIAEQLELVRERCIDDAARHGRMLERRRSGPRWPTHGIRIVRVRRAGREAANRLRRYFEEAIFPVLTPLVVDPAHPFPFI